MFKRIFIAFLVLMFLSLPVMANDGVMGRNGESVYMMDDNDVRMVSEDILLTYGNMGMSTVECTFVFHNTGDAKKVLMGFPAMVEYDPDNILGDPEHLRLTDFTAYCNGVQIEVNELDGADVDNGYAHFTSWYVFEVPFEAGETLTMTHTYDLHLWGDSGGNLFMGYVLETGSSWKGLIEHTKVTFDISPFNAYAVQNILDTGLSSFMYPLSSLRYENGMIVFEQRDYEPHYNILLWLSWYGLKDYEQISEFRQDDEWESVAFFEAAPGYTESRLIDAYNNLSYMDKTIETIYLNTVLGLPETNTAPYATDIERNEADGFTVTISDPDFDLDTGSVVLKVRSEYGTIVQERSTYGAIDFGDYGTRLFNTRDVCLGNSYELTASDHSGNTTVSIFNFYFDLVEVKVIGGQTDDIDNPETSATVQNGFVMSLVLFATGTFLVILRKKTA